MSIYQCHMHYQDQYKTIKIRDSVTTSVCKNLIHGLVTSRLDYGNAMLFGITDRLLHRLEMVQRSAARIVMQIRRGDRQSMTTILRQLHWLPIKRDGLSTRYSSLCTRHSTEANQSTLPHCFTSTHHDAAYALPAGYFSTCHESTWNVSAAEHLPALAPLCGINCLPRYVETATTRNSRSY